MASTARYVSGDCKPTAVKCDPNYPIEVGDLLFLEPSNNLARPASALVNQGSEALNQGALHDVFLGVALQKNGLQSNEVVPLNSTHQPQSGQRDRSGHGGAVPLRLRGDGLAARQPGGRGQQQRRHGPAKPEREERGQHLAGRSAAPPRPPTRSASP